MLDDGTPFFWLGDTVWELFHRYSRSDIDLLLETRASQGFNVIQAVCLAEENGLLAPNREGNLPLIDLDPTRPDLKDGGYWDLVDYAIDRAASLGLYVALLPTWGDKILKAWGQGPEVFSAESAFVYGKFIGERYGSRGNIIWVAGGDRPTEDRADIFEAMALGMRAGEPVRRLMTFHPPGPHSSSEYFHDSEWLDLNMVQSGHGWFDTRSDLMVEADYNRLPTKPVLDGEPNYENHRPFKAIFDLKDPSIPAFCDRDVRRASYSSVFAGGCGITYGCHAVWQGAGPDYSPVNFPIGTWQQSLRLPGAEQVRHLKSLMLCYPYFERIPDQSLIVEGLGEGVATARACRDVDSSFAMVYLPTSRRCRLSMATQDASWFNPRSGDKTPAEPIDGYFEPPTSEDWVLVCGLLTA